MFKYRLFRRTNRDGRASPIWWVAIGRRVKETTGTADKVSAHEYAQARAECLWRETKLGDRAAVSFATTAEKWLSSSAKEKKADREILRWLLPKIGHRGLCDVAHEEALEELRSLGLAQGWTRSTVDRMMTTVSAVLNYPRRRKGLKDENGLDVLPRISVPKYNEKLAEPQYLTPEQYARLLAELPEHQRLYQQLGTATLLRMDSLLKLTWARVDRVRKVAWIPAAEMKQDKPHRFPLSEQACQILAMIEAYQEREHARQVAHSQAHGRPIPPYPPQYVCTYRGRRIQKLTRSAFRRARERAGMPWVTTHIMSRHTGASYAAQSGVTLEERMKLGGWEDERSARRYSHLESTQVHRAAECVGQMLNRAIIVNSDETVKKSDKTGT